MRDEEFSKAVCKKLEVPFTVFHYDVPQIAKEEKLSLEEAGRNVRREAFEKVMKNIKVSGRKRIALAHHENDNAETVLHNLMRGSGAAGLGGIRPVSGEMKNIKVSGRKRIALAHHENDNAETVLHNLMRGSGAAGLGGIRPVSGEKDSYIRPLLFVKRAEIEKYLKTGRD